MNERTKILEMLASGKISVEDAEKLLSAIGDQKAPAMSEGKAKPKYLRVEVNANRPEAGKETVNIRVPFDLLRAGVKLAAIMPNGVQDKVSSALAEKGIKWDLSKTKGEDLDALIEQIQDLSIDVESDQEKVRVFVE